MNWSTIKKHNDTNRRLWHSWFAWYPIKIRNTRYWLETIYRRRLVNDLFWEWEYRRDIYNGSKK